MTQNGVLTDERVVNNSFEPVKGKRSERFLEKF